MGSRLAHANCIGRDMQKIFSDMIKINNRIQKCMHLEDDLESEKTWGVLWKGCVINVL